MQMPNIQAYAPRLLQASPSQSLYLEVALDPFGLAFKRRQGAGTPSAAASNPFPRQCSFSLQPAKLFGADISCMQASATQAALAAVQQGKVPYNSVNLVAVGPGGAGKTATRRSIMGLEFSAVRKSTVGGEQEHLLISLTRGDMVGFKSIQDVKQLERALLHYLHHSQKADANVERAQKLLELVQNNAGADEAQPLSCIGTAVLSTGYWLGSPTARPAGGG